MSACVVVLGLAVGCASPAPWLWAGLPAPTDAVTAPAVPAAALRALPGGARDVGAGGDRWLAEDKLRHFGMSFAATTMAYGGARFALDADAARPAAAGVAAALGLGKELADARGGGRFSLKDLAWDALGVALGYTFIQRIR